VKVERSDDSELLCTIFIKILFLSLTDSLNDLPCSHVRALLVYTDALANNCTLWGVKTDEFTLRIRYDRHKLVRDGGCLFPGTGGKGS
jgi:hypothetical protein